MLEQNFITEWEQLKNITQRNSGLSFSRCVQVETRKSAVMDALIWIPAPSRQFKLDGLCSFFQLYKLGTK